MDWLTGYAYRQKVPLKRIAGAVSDYQMKLTVHKGAGDSVGDVVYLKNHSLSWTGTIPNDIRFTKADGTTELDYWIQDADANTAIIWVEFDPIGTTDTDFYVYYGKSGDTTTSNGPDTFVLFDDFEDGNLDGWTQHNARYPAIISQDWDSPNYSVKMVRPTPTWSDCGIKKSVATTNVKAIVDCKITAISNGRMILAEGSTGHAEKETVDTFLNWESGEITDAASWDFIIRTGLTAASTDGVTGYIDRVRIRKYIDPEPTWGTWGSEEPLVAGGRSFGYIMG